METLPPQLSLLGKCVEIWIQGQGLARQVMARLTRPHRRHNAGRDELSLGSTRTHLMASCRVQGRSAEEARVHPLQEGSSSVWLCVLQPVTQWQSLMRGLQCQNARHTAWGGSMSSAPECWSSHHPPSSGSAAKLSPQNRLSASSPDSCLVTGSATLPQWEIHFTLLTWSLASLDTSQGCL